MKNNSTVTETNSVAAELTALLLRHFPAIRLAILFGSLASGKGRPGSDVDLAVLADSPLEPSEKTAIISTIADSLGRPVDLIDLRTAGEPLLGEVLRGKRILGDNTRLGQLMTKHLLDAADFVPYQQRILRERRNRWINSR